MSGPEAPDHEHVVEDTPPGGRRRHGSVVDTRRHLRRNAYEEDLAPEAYDEIKEEARLMYEEDILYHDLGVVFYVIPSNMGRARDTRVALEQALRDVVREHRDRTIAFVDYHDKGAMARATRDHSKRWVVVNLPDAPEIGSAEGEGRQVSIIWKQYQQDLREMTGDSPEMASRVHNLLSMINVAQAHELPALAEELRRATGSDLSDEALLARFNTREFLRESSPEDEAADQLETLLVRSTQMIDRFPGKHLHGLFVGHAPVLDYITMGMIGMPITLENWKKLGGIRGFFEPARFTFNDSGDLVMASFREYGLSTSTPIKIQDVVARLRAEGAARRASFGLT